MAKYTYTQDHSVEQWTKEGSYQPHRENGLPAMVSVDGSESYFEQGLRHRVGGPAMLYHSYDCIGSPILVKEWWVDGAFLRKEHFVIK